MGFPTTVKGTAFWTYAFLPDTKFKSEGEYKIKFRLSGEDAVSFQKTVDKLAEDSVAKAKEDNPAKKIKAANKPYSEVVDENGNETGELEFKFTQRAVIPTKRGDMQMRVAVFDSKGTPINDPVEVGNGSTVKVAYEPNLWYVPSSGAGVSLRFKGLQIIDLVARETANDGFGFGEEEGYSHENNNNNNSDDDHDFSEEEGYSQDEDQEEDF